jgi:hypothetical protein
MPTIILTSFVRVFEVLFFGGVAGCLITISMSWYSIFKEEFGSKNWADAANLFWQTLTLSVLLYPHQKQQVLGEADRHNYRWPSKSGKENYDQAMHNKRS